VKKGEACNCEIRQQLIVARSDILYTRSELGYLMCMKSKYGPGGEFDPDWYVFDPLYCFARNLFATGNLPLVTVVPVVLPMDLLQNLPTKTRHLQSLLGEP
jgi:hypothetical protein